MSEPETELPDVDHDPEARSDHDAQDETPATDQISEEEAEESQRLASAARDESEDTEHPENDPDLQPDGGDEHSIALANALRYGR